MTTDIDREGVARAYGRWAPIYDLVFGRVFEHGRQSTIAEADRIGGRVLDVGVGTGLSLADYSPATMLCGVDISEPMLRKAQERVRSLGLKNVETLAVMDAKNLAFADASFDAVVAQYVITAVPDPEATLDDFVRVLKPGGELILVNHIGAENGLRRAFELAFAPLARRLGWRPEFPWARLVDWAARHRGVSLIERRPMPPLGHFSLIRFERDLLSEHDVAGDQVHVWDKAPTHAWNVSMVKFIYVRRRAVTNAVFLLGMATNYVEVPFCIELCALLMR